MTFIKNKFFKSISKTDVSAQTVTDSYIEIEGSRVAIEKLNVSSDLYYFFSFLVLSYYANELSFLHIKLQKSNDNFSSNIVDVANCSYNFSTDTGGGVDYLNKANNVMFLVQNTGNDSLRLVTRAYSSSNRAQLHQATHFDGSTGHTKYYYPTLTVKEL